jgi:hypothetical protein
VRGGAVRLARGRLETRSAVRQARQLCSSEAATVCVCWDLDNTLVDSGTLLRAGKQLKDAVVEAEAVPNMLDFYATVGVGLPNAAHFILSARTRSMRADTLAWLRRNGITLADGAICFLPYPSAKPKVWRQLARRTKLVIVDDLSYNHESDQRQIYNDLVRSAQGTASVYVGIDEIARIAKDRRVVDAVASRVVEALAV